MASISLSTRLEYSKVELEKKSVVHLLVNLKAQSMPSGNRKPISVSAVIDCSGSMQGQKIEYAKKTLRELARHMTGDDTLSISGFSDDIWSILPSTKMDQAGREKAGHEIDKIRSIASTNLSGAVIEGWDRIKESKDNVARVIIFTDGLPTAGITDKGQLISMSGKRPNERASLTSMGYGMDCDKELLSSMAKTGGGNFYFVNTPDECLSIFGLELGGLLSCVAQQIKVRIDVEKDVKIIEILNDYDVEADDKDHKWAVASMGDAYAEETRRVLVKLELPEVGRTLGARPIHIGTVRADFFDILSNESRWEEAKIKVEFVPASEVQKDADIEVREQIAIQKAAKAQEEAMKLAEQYDWKGAQSIICMAIQDLGAVGTLASKAFAADLNANVLNALKDSAEYKTAGGAHYMYSNSSAYKSGRSSSKKSSFIGTGVQGSTMASFEKADENVDPAPADPVNTALFPKFKATPVKNDTVSKKKRR